MSYTDQQLIQILTKAARRVNRKLHLFSTTKEITINQSTGEILTPVNDNDELYDLVLIQAECMLASRDFQEELRNIRTGIVIKDGEQTVDTASAGVARGTFWNSGHSPCEELKTAIRDALLEGPFDGPGRLVW